MEKRVLLCPAGLAVLDRRVPPGIRHTKRPTVVQPRIIGWRRVISLNRAARKMSGARSIRCPKVLSSPPASSPRKNDGASRRVVVALSGQRSTGLARSPPIRPVKSFATFIRPLVIASAERRRDRLNTAAVFGIRPRPLIRRNTSLAVGCSLSRSVQEPDFEGFRGLWVARADRPGTGSLHPLYRRGSPYSARGIRHIRYRLLGWC